jgi:hypothetical protein
MTDQIRAAHNLYGEGLTYVEISKRLGVAHTTVVRWLHPDYDARQRKLSRQAKERRRTHCGCGELRSWDNPDGLCYRCFAARRTGQARNRMIGAIRRWVGLHNDLPTARAWNTIEGRHAPGGPWPSVKSAQRLFGSWSNATKAAGFIPREPGQRGHAVPRRLL